MSAQLNFSAEDFTLDKKQREGFTDFIINKKCPVLGNFFENETEPLYVCIEKNLTLNESLPKINEYLNWLNGDDCKNALAKFFCALFNTYAAEKITVEQMFQNKWYENMEIYSAGVTVLRGAFEATIICGDNCYETQHLMTVEIYDNEITRISLDG